MSKEEEVALKEAIANLTDEDEMPRKQIRVKQPKMDEYRVRVHVIPNHEQVVNILRYLEDEEFKEVVRAAKQYRKADKILYKA